MRSVVFSIAVHAVLGAIVMVKVTTRSGVVEVVAEPPPIKVELYVELPVAERAHDVGATRSPASQVPAHAARSSRGGGAVATATSTVVNELPPSPVAAPAVVSLPSPHDAVAEVTLPAARAIDNAPPSTTSANTFRMRVAADGTAHLTDRRNFQWGRGESAAHVEEAKAERWLDEHHEQSNVVDMKQLELATVARFDVTDAAMRLSGQDPYAYEKLRLLDATRDERAQIGARHHERQVLDTPALVRASLADIARLPADQRAAAIRALYLECDDSAAGEIARTTIVDYVHARGLAIDLRSP